MLDASARIMSARAALWRANGPLPRKARTSRLFFTTRRAPHGATKTATQAWRIACISAVDGTPCLYSRQAYGGLSDGINNISISSEALGTR
jgi:invasion protein IalB